MSKDTGGQAFPQCVQYLNGNIAQHVAGMTVRDYFAAKAMQAAATNSVGAAGLTFAERANWAYQQADAMLAERSKQ